MSCHRDALTHLRRRLFKEIYLSLSLYLSLSRCASLSRAVPLSLSLCLPLSCSISLSLALSLSFLLYLSRFRFTSLSHCTCLSLALPPSLVLYLSFGYLFLVLQCGCDGAAEGALLQCGCDGRAEGALIYPHLPAHLPIYPLAHGTGALHPRYTRDCLARAPSSYTSLPQDHATAISVR